MEEAFRDLLTGYAPLVSLLGNNTGNNPGAGPSIYWNLIPQSAKDPAVVLYKVTGAPGYHMQGADGLEASLVQINVRALTVQSMWAISRAIKDRLSGFKGSVGNTEFQAIFWRDERQNAEKSGTTQYHTNQIDFDVWSRPSV